jgi:hypothetical protein
MSATDEERIIAVAEAMMRQSRRAGGVVDPVSHSYVKMPKRTAQSSIATCWRMPPTFSGPSTKLTDHGQGNEQRSGRFSCSAWVCSGWVVRLEMAARPAEPWQVGLIGFSRGMGLI